MKSYIKFNIIINQRKDFDIYRKSINNGDSDNDSNSDSNGNNNDDSNNDSDIDSNSDSVVDSNGDNNGENEDESAKKTYTQDELGILVNSEQVAVPGPKPGRYLEYVVTPGLNCFFYMEANED